MSPSYLLLVFILCCGISNVIGDCYMQNPRGNNDRLNEEGDRNNAQRLFDSENNARGGYCWGPELTFYEGSILSVEWTTQHACGNDNTKCNLVLQYMCSSDDETADPLLIIRDGTTTNTISTQTDPANADYYNKKGADGRFTYGMNEPYWVYQQCRQRSRNKGLFIAEEDVSDNQGAMATRQNANGQRHGFECSEERDYYPYWHPSVWKDIAVLVDHESECDYYTRDSQNVKAKNWCDGTTNAQKAANNENECLTNGGTWATTKPWGIGKPDCKQAAWNRDNHLGNGIDGHTNSYNWSLPRSSQEDCIENGNCTCILRLRYNITVGEVQRTDDLRKNDGNSPVQDDPTVTVEGNNFTLALDTAQTGRGFQDRSYMFRIAPRPDGVSRDAKIYNLNVRGKRGNIVQTYPATEYDFVPTFLEVDQNDFIHFQWTGCDTNNGNAQGEGRTKTDRSNIVQIADMSKNYPLNDTELSKVNKLFKDDKLRNRMAMIDQVNCKNYEQLKADQNAGGDNVDNNLQNCMLLNAAPPRFSGAIVKMTDIGTYYYMSTRNNNFSNRSQKASISVRGGWPAWKTAVIAVSGVVGIAIGAAAGTIFYAKRHPLSKVAEVVHKIPGLSRI